MATGVLPAFTNYQIVRAVGSGGMSTVYEAIDTKLKRPVAIKVMHPHLCNDPTAVERFRREALAAASLDHPNIVRIYDYVFANRTACIVMEYVTGPDVESVVKERGPLPFDSARYVMAEVAAALEAAHQKGVLHRDVKPSNILLQRGNRVMLTDFGLARRQLDTRLTQHDAVAGTPSFMSPEQMNNRDLTSATDVYAWGVTFHNVLSGRLPYAHQSFPEIVADIQNGRTVIDPQVRAVIPGRYLALLERCLVAEPGERVASGEELRKALAGCGDAVPVDLTPLTSAPRRPSSGPTTGDISVTQIYRAHRAGPVRTALAILSAVAAAAVLFVAALWYIDRFRPRPPANAPSVPPETTQPVAGTLPASASDTAARAPDPAPPAEAVPARTVRPPARAAPSGSRAVADSGQLFVFCSPWANVQIDGVLRGRTPLESPITLSRGSHMIRLYNDFCEPLEDEVEIVSKTVLRRRYTLRVKPAYRE